jgi:translation elongation factor EF-Tu-like GTPase
MSAANMVLKQKVAKIIREKVDNGLDKELGDKVKKEIFELINDNNFLTMLPVILAALLDSEVRNFAEK